MRCIGFHILHGSVCGSGYSSAYEACDACKPRHFEKDGLCEPCEVQLGAVWSTVAGLGTLIGVLVAMYCLVLLSLHFALHRAPSIPPGKHWLIVRSIASDFIVWFCILLQLLVQVARTSAPGMPTWMRYIISNLQVLQFDVNGVFPAACSAGGSELRAIIILGLAMVLTIVCVVLLRTTYNKPSKLGILWGLVAYYLFTFVLLMYPLVANTAITTLRCTTNNGRSVWVGDQATTCFSPERAPVLALAFLSIPVSIVGLPVYIIIKGRQHIRRLRQHSADSQHRQYSMGQRLACAWCCCCGLRTTTAELNELIAMPLPWTGFYRYGEPWLRPLSLLEMLAISFLAQSVEWGTYATRLACTASIAVIAMSVGLLTFILKPDPEFSTWKRLPRFLLDWCLVVLCSVQASFIVDDEATRGEVGVTAGISTASRGLVWLLVAASVLYPLVVLGIFLHWVRNLRSAAHGEGISKARHRAASLSFIRMWIPRESLTIPGIPWRMNPLWLDGDATSAAAATPNAAPWSHPSEQGDTGTETAVEVAASGQAAMGGATHDPFLGANNDDAAAAAADLPWTVTVNPMLGTGTPAGRGKHKRVSWRKRNSQAIEGPNSHSNTLSSNSTSRSGKTFRGFRRRRRSSAVPSSGRRRSQLVRDALGKRWRSNHVALPYLKEAAKLSATEGT